VLEEDAEAEAEVSGTRGVLEEDAEAEAEVSSTRGVLEEDAEAEAEVSGTRGVLEEDAEAEAEVSGGGLPEALGVSSSPTVVVEAGPSVVACNVVVVGGGGDAVAVKEGDDVFPPPTSPEAPCPAALFGVGRFEKISTAYRTRNPTKMQKTPPRPNRNPRSRLLRTPRPRPPEDPNTYVSSTSSCFMSTRRWEDRRSSGRRLSFVLGNVGGGRRALLEFVGGIVFCPCCPPPLF
jgi:hypothetical protein